MRISFIQVTSDDLKDMAAILRAASEGRLFVEEQEASDNREVTAEAVATARPSAASPSPECFRPRKAVRLVPTRATFRMVCADGVLPQMAQRLYVGLTALEMLDGRTCADDVMGLLSGESDCRLRWTGGAESLAYFAKRLLRHPAVSLPTGATIWMVVRSHFVRPDGRCFGDELAHQHSPRRLKEAIDLLVEALDPSIGRDEFVRLLNG